MIGGDDITLQVQDSPAWRSAVEEHFRASWPALVVEVDPNGSGDVFYYRNEASRKSWDAFGHTDEYGDSMVYVMYCEEQTSFVVSGEADSQTKFMVNSLKKDEAKNV